jgi:hypothetical protein
MLDARAFQNITAKNKISPRQIASEKFAFRAGYPFFFSSQGALCVA